MISPETDESIVDRGRTSSVLWVLAATVVAGISGYLVMWAVARAVGAADYSIFGVFWSGLFLIVGVLFGVQQETTRSTADALHRNFAAEPRSSLWIFAGVLSLIVLVLVLVTGIWWGPATLGAENAGLTVQIALGSAANAIVATISGVVAGARLWRHLGAIIAIDGIVRLVAVLLVLIVSTDPGLLAWAVIVPFPLSIGIVFLISPRPFLRLSRSSLSYRHLATNALHTMLAASATALVINGFPILLSFFALSSDKALLGALILAITITRAPILVPLMAMQSYLVTRFTGMTVPPWSLIRRAFAVLTIVMLMLAGATALWGTTAFELLIGAEFALSTAELVPLVVSSGFIGALCVTGPALLASGQHRGYAAGWLLSSAVAISALFLPIDLATKAALALSAGPVCGLVLHLIILRNTSTRS